MKTKNDGKRCKHSRDYINHSTSDSVRLTRAARTGIIAGEDDYGNLRVKWDEKPGFTEAWSPNCIEIES